jgi:exonuclease VII large subunit
MLLFFVGLIFAMLAAFKGYYLFGSLPGYQKVCKDYEKAVENAEGIERILKTQIDSMITSEKNNLSQLLRNLTEINKALNKIKANVKSSKTHFEATSAEIFEAVNLVIKNYRQMNSKSRPANIPPPDYFKKDLSNTYEIIPTYFLLEESTNEISTRSEDLFTNISASINEQINSLSSFKAFELGPAIQEFMDKVRDDAKNLFISTIPRNGSE